jgi:thioredoxin 1
MKIQNLNTDKFKETIENIDKPILIDFYADWCGPCKVVAPIVDKIAEENEDIAVYRVNVDDNPDLATEFAIMSIPTFISFKGGKIYKKTMGVQMKEAILNLIK